MCGACRPCCHGLCLTATAASQLSAFLPYGRQEIGDADIKAVVEALVSGWLTTGPRVAEFEQAFARHCGAAEGVAVNSGTAALHAAMRAIGVRTGDEVIVPALTFAASANAAIYEGATPVFADVEARHAADRSRIGEAAHLAPHQGDRGGGLCRPARRLRRPAPDRRAAAASA